VTDATTNAAFDLQVFHRAIDLVGHPRRGRFKAEVREMTPASVGQKPG
jgi:hypothetical protein